MTRVANAVVCAIQFSALTGCLSPATTRLPTLGIGPPAYEKRSFERFDPYADDKLGPETHTRPPAFENNREPQRRAIEGQMLEGAPAGPVPPGFSTGAYRNDNVVQ